MALTDDLTKVLQRFGRSPEGLALVAVLKDRLTAHDVKNRRRAGEDLVRGQGRAIELEELIDLLTAKPAVPQRPAQFGRPGARAVT